MYLILNFLLLFNSIYSNPIQQIKTILDMARMNPFDFGHKFNIDYACNILILEPFISYSQLIDSSSIQLSYLNDSQCAFQHDTCDKYCYLYQDCSYNSRISHYCPKCLYIAENIMKGIKDPFLIIKLFLGKPGHCENIFSSNHNIIGISYHQSPNIIVMNMAFLYKQFIINPIISGSHFINQNDSIIYYVNYLKDSSIYLFINETFYFMDLFIYPNTYSINLSIQFQNFSYYFTDHYFFLYS